MDNLTTVASQVTDPYAEVALIQALRGIYDRYRCQMLVAAGLVISATTANVKTGAAICYGLVKGHHVTIAAGVDMPVLVGSVTNAKFNVYCFFANKAGASLTAADMTVKMGAEASTLSGVRFPSFPEGKTLIGYVIINPTGTGNFVGGTTPLGDATVIPNAVYISPIGPFDPSATY